MARSPSIATTRLSRPQRRAIEALAAGATIAQAAAAAGVSTRTLYRWRGAPQFAAALREADADGLRLLARRLNAAAGDALTYLLAVVKDDQATAAARIRAAAVIFEHQARLYETTTMQDALEEFDRRLREGGL